MWERREWLLTVASQELWNQEAAPGAQMIWNYGNRQVEETKFNLQYVICVCYVSRTHLRVAHLN